MNIPHEVAHVIHTEGNFLPAAKSDDGDSAVPANGEGTTSEQAKSVIFTALQQTGHYSEKLRLRDLS